MIVVDASLAVKWFLPEQDSSSAITFLEQHDLAAPELLYIEVAGVLVRRGHVQKALYPEVLEALERWTVSWSDHVVQNVRVTQRRLLEACRLALSLGTPLKDCIYLTIAMEMGMELATCDRRFRDRAVAIYPSVKLLSDYGG